MTAHEMPILTSPEKRARPAWARPSWPGLLLFFAAYVAGAGLGQGLAIIPGVSITFWPPAGIFVGTLLLTPRRTWPWWIAAGALAELTGNLLWFHNLLHFALIYFAANALEALTAASLIRRLAPRASRLRTPESIAAFVLLAAAVAPIAGATIIAATDAFLGKHAFATAWPLVWLGDGSGILVSTPLVLVAVRAWRFRSRLEAGRVIEAAAVGLLLVVVCVLGLRGHLSTVYLALPPLVWGALRFQLPGAAVGIALVTLTVAAYTAVVDTPFTGSPAQMRARVVMVQTFLAVAAVSSLLVAGLSWRYHHTLRALRAVNAELESRVAARTAEAREREAEFRAMFELASVGKAQLETGTGRFLRVNDAFCTLTGRSREELLGLGFADITHPDDLAADRERMRRFVEGKSDHYDAENRYARPDGRVVWVHVAATLLRDAQGRPTHTVAVIQDISRRKHAEEELQRRSALLTAVNDNTTELIFVKDRDGRLIYANAATFRALGRNHLDQAVTDESLFVDLHEHATISANDRRVLETGQTIVEEEVYTSADGVRRIYLSTKSPLRDDGRIVGVVAVSRDETERRRAEEALRQSEARFRAMAEGLPQFVWETGPTGEALFTNARWHEYTGLAPDQVGADVWLTVMHPEDVPRMRDAWERALRTVGEYDGICRFRRAADGAYRWFHVRGAAIRDESGAVVRWVGACADIHDRIEAERALAVQKRLYQSITDNARTALFIMDDRQQCVFMNPAAEALTGYTLDETRGRPLHDVVHHTRPDGTPYPLAECPIDQAFPKHDQMSGEEVFVHKDGRFYPVAFTASPIPGPDGRPLGTVIEVQDISERQRAEAELRLHREELQRLVQERTEELRLSLRKLADSERLAALGNLAAGLGHDLANMILPLRLRLESLGATVRDPEAAEDVAMIGQSLDHLSTLSAGLRLMALDPTRDRASTPVSDLAAWWKTSEGVLRNALPRSVRLECSLAESGRGLGAAMPAHQLLQAVFNLVQNAGEALTGRDDGVVRISAAQGRTRAGAPAAALTVEDSGPGIPPEILGRIFEPYFSTKGRAIATGMGLGMVRGLVESSGGEVGVESTPGQGARFTLIIPVHAPSTPATGRPAGTPPATPGSAAVTLTNARHRAVIEGMLRAMGIEIKPGASTPLPPDADLWIAESPPRTALSAFLDGPSGRAASRRVVLLGDPRDSDGAQPAAPPDAARVIRVEVKPRPRTGGLGEPIGDGAAWSVAELRRAVMQALAGVAPAESSTRA